ncbi:MAG: FHA domain-containing protein [Pseudomonadales bacterium]
MSVKVILIKDKPIAQFQIERDITSIGRRSECDISIKDPAVSGSHAQIQKLGKNYVIEDLGSTNGVVYNGRKVKQQILRNNDVVKIGEHELKFLIAVTAPAASNARAPAVAKTSGQLDAQLVVTKGTEPGKTLTLEEGLTTIGVPGIQVAAVSRRPQGHFIIHVDGGKDKDRVPLVNGSPIGFKSHKLEDKDKIEVADMELEYRLL